MSRRFRSFASRGATLVVTVDCGAVSREPFEVASQLGLDVIVFDHHQAPEVLPKTAALVDPNREDDLSGLGYLCAAGVVFMALVALNRALREAGFWNGGKGPDLLASLDLVALATVADVVPLIGLNRAFVVKGLAIMRERRRPGLAALFDIAGADGPPRPYHLGFVIGPRINAGGRIGDAALGVRLLTATDDIEARAIAIELDRLNRIRQQIEIEALAEAEAEALFALGLEERGAAVVVAGATWPPGIVGLLAARLKERFERPAFALTPRRRAGDRLRPLDRGRRSRPGGARGDRSGRRDQGRRTCDGGGRDARDRAARRLARLSRGAARPSGDEGARRSGSQGRRGADGDRGDAGTRPSPRGGRPLWRGRARAFVRLAAPSPGGGDARRRRAGAICACARSRATGGRSRASRSAPPARSSARRSSGSRARRCISPGRCR